MQLDPVLRVIRYRYFAEDRDEPVQGSRGPGAEDFRRQLAELTSRFEIASMECSLDFLNGEYRPRRDLCLLTFDGGLKEHLATVVPLLRERRVRGAFFLITSCLTGNVPATIHMSDWLSARLGVAAYTEALLGKAGRARRETDHADAAAMYPLDTPEVARLKYVYHYGLDAATRDTAVRELFAANSAASEPASSLYITWEDARSMQKAGMCMGGASHRNSILATLPPEELNEDLETCRGMLARNLSPQAVWPFCYPWGKLDSFHVRSMRKLQSLGFHCAFSSEPGANRRRSDPFTLRRTGVRQALAKEAAA